MFSVAYSEGSPWNDSRWSNAEFNKLLVAARLESNDAKRRELYYEMQRICKEPVRKKICRRCARRRFEPRHRAGV